MVSERHTHHIQPLNGNNYTTWSKEMKALLHSKGLWHLVDGKEGVLPLGIRSRRPGTSNRTGQLAN